MSVPLPIPEGPTMARGANCIPQLNFESTSLHGYEVVIKSAAVPAEVGLTQFVGSHIRLLR